MWTPVTFLLVAVYAALGTTLVHIKQNHSSPSYDVKRLRSMLGSESSKKYEVGMRLPNTSFDIPPSWAGNIPVSNNTNETRHLYFWMFPATGDVGHDDLMFWMNGGPGCSSLSSMIGENGPLKFDYETFEAKPIEQTWTKLANIVWLDQPAGTGFALGEPKNQSMREVAQDFYGFLRNFYEAFPKVRGKRLWIGGESFAGKMVPFLADEVYRHEEENKKAGIDLRGINVNDPLFAPNPVTKDLPAVEYGLAHAAQINLTAEQVAELQRIGKENGVEHFVRDNLHYPPKGPLKIPKELNTTLSPHKQLQNMIRKNNPCTSPFYIMNHKCHPDAMGMNVTKEKSNAHNYFNLLPEAKKYINAPVNVTWVQCSKAKPFETMKNAKTGYPVPEVLSRVIEKSERSVVQHGTYDMIVLYNGTALVLQNMTWHGKQGFQNPPTHKLPSTGDHEVHYQSERGLTFFIVHKAGHMLPTYAPEASFRMVQHLLGQKQLDDE